MVKYLVNYCWLWEHVCVCLHCYVKALIVKKKTTKKQNKNKTELFYCLLGRLRCALNNNN